jgi:DnaD/phage-associated family protein
MSDPDMDISISSIADRFDHTEKDVLRALRYFAGKGLISIEYNDNDELSAVTFLPVNSEFTIINRKPDESSKPSDSSGAAESTEALPPKPHYSPADLKRLSMNEELQQLLYITQKYLGKTLTTSEINTIIYLYESLNFSSDLIEYLIEYCVNNNHKSMRYIEKVALSWAGEGIDTIEKAKINTSRYNSNVYSVMKAFGISGRNPAESERKLITKWYQDFCFDNEIVLEACNRTIKAIHTPSFEYADAILTYWKNNNVTRLSDVNSLDEAKPARSVKVYNSIAKPTTNKFNDFPQRTYDFDSLERQLMKKFESEAMED